MNVRIWGIFGGMMEHTHDLTHSINDYDFKNKIKDEVNCNYLVTKRVLDIIFSIVLLIPASLIMLIFMILVRLETPGKSLYHQERVGYRGNLIMITKIRSMYQDAEKKSGAIWAQKNDARVTKIGHFMRKTRIDELPQLISVIKGDLSLIGPRPERPKFTQQFSEEYPGFEQRLLVKPGLSGWAQVNGGYDDNPGEKLKKDLYYIDHFGLGIDLKIFWYTLTTVITGKGAR